MRRAPSAWQPMGVAAGLGLAFGALTALIAFALARYGPAGGDWSFRGNGALAAYSLIPALLAGGWTAVVLLHRRRGWVGWAVGTAIVGIALAVVDAALLPVFGPGADRTAGPVVLLALVAWTALAPLVALLRTKGGPVPPSIASSIGAAALWAAGLLAGLVLTGFVLPAGS